MSDRNRIQETSDRSRGRYVAAFLVPVLLGGALMVSQTACRPRPAREPARLTTGYNQTEILTRYGNDGVELQGQHASIFQSKRTTRLELIGGAPDTGFGISISLPRPIDDLQTLATAIPSYSPEGQWWGFPAGNDGFTVLDSQDVGPPNDYHSNDQSWHAFTYDEGLCSVTIPWDAANLDPWVSAFLGPHIGKGLAESIVDGFDEGMKPWTGSQPPRENHLWFADFLSGLYVNTGVPTQLMPDFQADANDKPDHRVCLRSYYHFQGELNWKEQPDSMGEALRHIFSPLLDFLSIGECPGQRLTALTICGQFDVTNENDQWWQQVEGIDPEPVVWNPGSGFPTFRVDEVRAWINRWPRARVGCNNNKWKFEDAIEATVAGTIESSLSQLLTGLTLHLPPFRYERAFMTAEGLTMVIAENANDPDYDTARTMFLCDRPRPAQTGELGNVIFVGDLP